MKWARQRQPVILMTFLIVCELALTADGLEYLMTRPGSPLNQALPTRTWPIFQQIKPLEQRLANGRAFEIEAPESTMEFRLHSAMQAGLWKRPEAARRDRVEVRWLDRAGAYGGRSGRNIRRAGWAPDQKKWVKPAPEGEAAMPAVQSTESLRIPDLIISLVFIFICVLLIYQNRRMKYADGVHPKPRSR